MPDPGAAHGTVARYRSGCSCDACFNRARSNAEQTRDRRRAKGKEPGWAVDLHYEATAHPAVSSLDHRRRLAMALRRGAEAVNEKGAQTLSNLMRMAADELDPAPPEEPRAPTERVSSEQTFGSFPEIS